MNKEDYPALSQAASHASNHAQWSYLKTNLSYLIITILATMCIFLSPFSTVFSSASAFLFLVGFVLLLLILLKKTENTWYACRAIAESIKTASWRFMMCAEPFGDPNLAKVKMNFLNLIREIIRQNTSIAHCLGGELSEKDQITEQMLKVRTLAFSQKKEFYILHRIDVQKRWYAEKCSNNKKHNRIFFSLAIVFNLTAALFAILKFANPQNKFFPVAVFATISVSLLTWIKLKKYQELSVSYSLAAFEIGIIKGFADDIKTEKELSDFVIDSENAFSREHTQWIAKRMT